MRLIWVALSYLDELNDPFALMNFITAGDLQGGSLLDDWRVSFSSPHSAAAPSCGPPHSCSSDVPSCHAPSSSHTFWTHRGDPCHSSPDRWLPTNENRNMEIGKFTFGLYSLYWSADFSGIYLNTSSVNDSLFYSLVDTQLVYGIWEILQILICQYSLFWLSSPKA